MGFELSVKIVPDEAGTLSVGSINLIPPKARCLKSQQISIIFKPLPHADIS